MHLNLDLRTPKALSIVFLVFTWAELYLFSDGVMGLTLGSVTMVGVDRVKHWGQYPWWEWIGTITKEPPVRNSAIVKNKF